MLSAIGYHQPPVYFLPSFTLHGGSGVHSEEGGRFRLHTKSLKDSGQWSWQENPFVGTKPYQGLLVILMMFDSSDLKNDNNTLYQVRTAHQAVQTWYVVQDLGTSLGETGRLNPKRGDADLFASQKFIKGVKEDSSNSIITVGPGTRSPTHTPPSGCGVHFALWLSITVARRIPRWRLWFRSAERFIADCNRNREGNNWPRVHAGGTLRACGSSHIFAGCVITGTILGMR